MSALPTDQSRDVRWLVKIIAWFAVAVAALVLLFLYDHKIMAAMLRDRAEWGGQPFYLGAVSQIGILTWAAGAAVALFTATAVRGDGISGDRLLLLRCIGLFTLALCLDDAFQVHEVVAPRYLYIDQKAVLLLYAVSALAIGMAFRRLLLKRPLLPVAAAVALATSVGLDLSEPYWTNITIELLVEDSFKQLGIVLWTGFILQQALAALAERRATQLAPAILKAETDFIIRNTSPASAVISANIASSGG